MSDPTTAELRRAARRLLQHPHLSTAEDADTLATIRRHRGELAALFADELGYTLDATRPNLVRLAKVAGPVHVPRGMSVRAKRFTPHRYAILCLVLAAIDERGDRVTAAHLFEDVEARAAAAKIPFDSTAARERRAFIAAVHAVEALGVMVPLEGDLARWADNEANADALWRIDRDRFGQLLVCTVPPSMTTDRSEITATTYPDTKEGRTRAIRHRVQRALVEQPVVYVADLTEEEHEYLTSQRPRIERLLAERFGLTLEVRAEGYVAVDEDGDCTDRRWPDYGTDDVAALRIVDALRLRHLAGTSEPWPEAEVVHFVQGLAVEYAKFWRDDAATDAGAAAIAANAISTLAQLRLVSVEPDGAVRALPGCGRFAAPPRPSATDTETPQTQLFPEETS